MIALKYRVHTDPWYGAGFGVENEEVTYVLGELNSSFMQTDYILESIANMSKVMQEGFYFKKEYRYTKKLENGEWDRSSLTESKVKSDSANISSGEGCTVHLSKDRCVILDLYHGTEIEVDPQDFYRLMKDWEAAILKWQEERVGLILARKKEAEFVEYFKNANYHQINTLLKRELLIVEEDAAKRGVTKEELRKLLKTDVLEEINEIEKKIHFLKNGYQKTEEQIKNDADEAKVLKPTRQPLDHEYLGIEATKPVVDTVEKPVEVPPATKPKTWWERFTGK